jgi:hypothetical protein
VLCAVEPAGERNWWKANVIDAMKSKHFATKEDGMESKHTYKNNQMHALTHAHFLMHSMFSLYLPPYIHICAGWQRLHCLLASVLLRRTKVELQAQGHSFTSLPPCNVKTVELDFGEGTETSHI